MVTQLQLKTEYRENAVTRSGLGSAWDGFFSQTANVNANNAQILTGFVDQGISFSHRSLVAHKQGRTPLDTNMLISRSVCQRMKTW